MSRKPRLDEVRTDLESLSVGVQGSNGTSELTEEILRARRDRLRKQNTKLDFDIQRQEQQFVDFDLIKQQVLRANATVKSSLFALCIRVSEPLAVMDDPIAIEAFLRAELTQTLNSLAFEHGRTTSADD
jgi:hypothetical protein